MGILPYLQRHQGRCSSLLPHCCDFQRFRNRIQLHHCEVQSLASEPSHSVAEMWDLFSLLQGQQIYINSRGEIRINLVKQKVRQITTPQREA